LILPVKEVFACIFWTISIMFSWVFLRMVLWIAGILRPSVSNLM